MPQSSTCQNGIGEASLNSGWGNTRSLNTNTLRAKGMNPSFPSSIILSPELLRKVYSLDTD